MLSVRLIDDLGGAESLHDVWDSLAIAEARPFSSPAWMLAWWRQARPRTAALRIVTVWDDQELMGIFPFFVDRAGGRVIRYRLLASTISAHVEPLAKKGSEREVAIAASHALMTGDPSPDVISFHGLPVSSPWPALLGTSDRTARGVWVHEGARMPAPRLLLEGRTYQEWFAGLSRHRRAEFRRRRRRLEERDAVVRLAGTADEVVAGLADFASLHYERWRPRGGSGVLDHRIEAMLAEAASELAPARFRLWSIDIDGRPVSSLLFVAAGGRVSYWLGGFDPRWAALGPAIETVRAALEHAWTLEDRVMDFGPGGQQYKYTFADSEDAVAQVDLLPRTSRFLRTRIALAPEYAVTGMKAFRHDAVRRLSPGTQQRLKAIRGRLRRFEARAGR